MRKVPTMEKIEVKSRYHHAKDAIVAYIRDKCRDGGQLPSEAQFAQMLGVSRNTVREAIRILEREGIVFSRHGVGTFIINAGQSLSSNLTILTRVADFIREHGYVADAAKIERSRIVADARLATRLAVEPGRELVRVSGVRTADGVPVIHVVDYFKHGEVWENSLAHFRDETFFACLQEHAGVRMSHSNCGVRAVISDAENNAVLDLAEPTSLLMLEQVHFSGKGEAVMYSDSWFISDKFNFTVVRRAF